MRIAAHGNAECVQTDARGAATLANDLTSIQVLCEDLGYTSASIDSTDTSTNSCDELYYDNGWKHRAITNPVVKQFTCS